jgi:hypothetical protein
MTTGLYTIPNSSINIKVISVDKVTQNSTTMQIFYLYKSGAVIDFEIVTVPNDALTHWIELEE